MAAGLGFKTFATGDVLSAADTNGYLMQGVLVFASATARDAAITSPQEGQTCYLKDTDAVMTYSGSAWVAVSSTVPTSYGYTAGKNKIINGDFGINQRNFTSITATGYGFDRWRYDFSTGTNTYTTQTFTLGTAPVAGYEGKNYAQVAITGQTLSSAYTIFQQNIEDVRNFAGQTVTISFWAKASSGTPSIGLEMPQVFGSGGSPSSPVLTNIVGSVTTSTTWTRYTKTFNVPSISGKTIGTDANTSYIQLQFWLSAGADYATRASSIGINTATFQIWGVQVEAGSAATAFQTATGTIQGELAACQRYYYRSSSAAGNPYSLFTQSFGANSTTQVYCSTRLPVTMRVAPTAVEYANLQVADGTNLTAVTTVAIDNNTTTQDIAASAFNVASGLTQYRPYAARGNNSSSAYLAYTAEL
jgi:hypothetical protein